MEIEALECRLLLSAETSLLSSAACAPNCAAESSDNHEAASAEAAVEQSAAKAGAAADIATSAFGDPDICALPDPSRPIPLAAPLTADLAFPLQDTFKLHSLPGATKRIYLDFDGHTTIGTDWNTFENGGGTILTPAYTLDADAAFSETELLDIQQVFLRVSEDFIGFNVDVTTEDPGAAALTNSGGTDTEWGIRVAIGGSYADWFGVASGGVAYLRSFTANSDTPCFVFPINLALDEKSIAEAASHEVGHTLGLSHDGRTNPAEGYYLGQGSGETSWAPIMGVGYYVNVTQWSKGEYANASNLEDDLAIITGLNGFGYRPNDFQLPANPLTFNAGVAKVNGILETGGNTTEQFSFTTTGGPLKIDLTPFSVGPGNDGANLDLAFVVLNQANGSVIQSFSPANAMEAHGQLNLAAGTYLIHVQGAGNANPLVDGYTDYASMGRYSLTVTLTEPEIDVKGNAVSIVDGDSSPTSNDGTAFGSQNVGSTSPTRTFTIANLGAGQLNLTGSPRVQITGLNAADFKVIAQPAATVAAGGTATFTIAFAPTASGLRTAIVNIASNDGNESPYNFNISGTGIAVGPEIDVRWSGVSIVNEDSTPSSTDGTAFGSQNAASGTVTRIFTIANTGSAALNLNGAPRVKITGLNASDFIVTVQPAATVAAGGTTTFTIAFDPTTSGLRTATVTIANNDSNENPYNFSIAGTGIITGPEIDVRWSGVNIADDDTSPSSTDGTAFGSQSVSSGTLTRVFTIANPGSATLNLTGGPRVRISGLNASDFTVTVQPPASVAAGGTATFTIDFNPSASGLRTAIVNIASNDSNESPYNFTISGTGTTTAAVPLIANGSVASDASQSSSALSTTAATPSTSSSTVTKSTAQSTNRRNATSVEKPESSESTLATTSGSTSTSDLNAVDDVFADASFGEILDAPSATATKNRSRRSGR